MANIETDMAILNFGGYEGKYVLPTTDAILIFRIMVGPNVYKHDSKYVGDHYMTMIKEVPPGVISITNISSGQVLQGKLNQELEEKSKIVA